MDYGLAREGACYVIRKGNDKPRGSWLDEWPDALCIDDYARRGGDSYLIEMFNRCRRFICYDHNSFLAMLAALCGCEVLIVPDGVRTLEQVVADCPFGMSGVAWALEDLDRAAATRTRLAAGSATAKACWLEQTKAMIHAADFISEVFQRKQFPESEFLPICRRRCNQTYTRVSAESQLQA